jgi:hypothetical protein
VCELLAVADLHAAEPLKIQSLAFIKANTAAVMATEGWAELVKSPALVNMVVGALSAALLALVPVRKDG